MAKEEFSAYSHAIYPSKTTKIDLNSPMSPGNNDSPHTVINKRSFHLSRALTGATRVTGIFGHPVGHSRSPAMQNAAFEAMGLDWIYVPFCVNPDNLDSAVQGIRALDLVGINVTMPHKQRVMEYLDWISDDARRIGSVNTIHNDNGILKGYSTDGPGFIRALSAVWASPKGANVVVIGAGGSARATVYALASEGANVTVINRTVDRAVDLSVLVNEALGVENVSALALDSIEARVAVSGADLLVNCTSVGMHPNVDAQPVPSEWLHANLFVYDQIYNPVETSLLKSAREAGAGTSNGMGMLVFQGAISFEIWTGQTPPCEIMEKAAQSDKNVLHSVS